MDLTTTEPSDAELIAVIRAGASERAVDDGYRRLVSRHWKVVLVLVRSRIGSEGDAEDVAQEVFLRAFRSLGGLEAPHLFLGWLLRIARNLATDHLRRRRGETSLEGLGKLFVESRVVDDESAHATHERLEREEEVERVMQAVDRLPEKYRTVVMLRYLEDLPYRDLAARLGEPEGTVRNRLFRALAKLRETLLPARHDVGSTTAGAIEEGAFFQDPVNDSR